jgi:hypothetical protein
MRKPPESISLTVHGADKLTPEQREKIWLAMVKKHEQDRRDYEMYQQGRRSSQGLLGMLGL